MSCLRPDLDLRDALRGTLALGAAFVPAALDEPFRRRLLSEVEDGPFEPLPERPSPMGVRQQADRFVVRDAMLAYPCVHELRDDLVAHLGEQAGQVPGVSAWLPDDASVQRYAPGSLGVTPHLDGSRFRYLVAVVTVAGSASFALCSDRAGTVLRQWETLPGSLVLMRAPGLAGREDERPLHTVRGPRQGQRLSLTYRMDAAAAR